MSKKLKVLNSTRTGREYAILTEWIERVEVMQKAGLSDPELDKLHRKDVLQAAHIKQQDKLLYGEVISDVKELLSRNKKLSFNEAFLICRDDLLFKVGEL